MGSHPRIRVLELRSVRGTGGGPEKTIMLGAAQSSRDDFEIIVCYIRDNRDQIFELERRAARLGIDYVEVRERHSLDRKSTRLNSSHGYISYAVFCLKKKK